MIRPTILARARIRGYYLDTDWGDAALVRLQDTEDGVTTYIPEALWRAWGERWPYQAGHAETLIQMVREREAARG